MNRVSVGQAWDETRAFLVANRALVAPILMALVALPQLVLRLAYPELGDLQKVLAGGVPGHAVWISYALLLLQLVAAIALMSLALGGRMTVGEAIAHGFRRMLPLLGALLLFGFVLGLVAVLVGVVAAMASGAEPAASPPPLLLSILGLMIVAGFARVALMLPAASAEPGGPVSLLKRGWALGRGITLKLLALLLLIVIASALVSAAATTVVGLATQAVLGSSSGMTLGGLLTGLVGVIIAAIMFAVMYAMLAFLYRQAAARAA